jgi:WhiB family redox-sensing transcriptional regulator
MAEEKEGYITNWVSKTLCSDLNDEEKQYFFPSREGGEGKRHSNKAKAICNLCPVSAECLLDALGRNEKYGIWGATSPRQRLTIKSAYSHTDSKGLTINEYLSIDKCREIIVKLKNSKGKMVV